MRRDAYTDAVLALGGSGADEPRSHVLYVCSGHQNDEMYNGHCRFCDGGLSACSVCNAFEGAWTSECAGVSVPPETWDRVYNDGDLDYVGGRWVAVPSPYSPAGRRRLEDHIQAVAHLMGWDHAELFTDAPLGKPVWTIEGKRHGYIGGSQAAPVTSD